MLQLWKLEKDGKKLGLYESFGAMYNAMADDAGVPRNNTAGLDTKAYEYNCIFSLGDKTYSSTLIKYIENAIDAINNDYIDDTRDIEQIMAEAIDNALPVYTADYSQIAHEDLNILHAQIADYADSEATALDVIKDEVYTIAYEAIDEYLRIVKKEGEQQCNITM